jgi:hypothetical protein
VPAPDPTDATTAQQPAYSAPISAAPTSAYPVGGYPAPQTPGPRRTSVWTWVFAGLAVLLLAGGGGLGYVYNEARGTVADKNNQIATLQSTVDAQAKDLTTSEGRLKAAQDDLKDANDEVTALEACKASVQKFVDALDGTEAESQAAALEMFNACDSNL